MFFRKKLPHQNGAAVAITEERTATGTIQVVLETVDRSIEQTKQAAESAEKLSKRICESIPQATRKRRTA